MSNRPLGGESSPRRSDDVLEFIAKLRLTDSIEGDDEGRCGTGFPSLL